MTSDMNELARNCSEDFKRANPDVFGAGPSKFSLKTASINQESRSNTARAVPNKYHAVKTEYGGRVYDSQKEARKAQELDLMVSAGEISFWLYHVRFPLHAGVTYEADFVTYQSVFYDDDEHAKPLWRIQVIETKGHWTSESKIKVKQFRDKYKNLELAIC